jgi:hypothetical protein
LSRRRRSERELDLADLDRTAAQSQTLEDDEQHRQQTEDHDAEQDPAGAGVLKTQQLAANAPQGMQQNQ